MAASSSSSLPSKLTLQSLAQTLRTSSLDFHALLSLATQVDQSLPHDIGAIDLVYDRLVAEFPLCSAFWVKHAMHRLRLCGPNDARLSYERALRPLTFSVDLWSSYCTFAARTFQDPSHVTRLFERALSFVGKDYLCHRIWDQYLHFEYSHKHWRRLASIYINILKFPSKKLHAYYHSFKKLVYLLQEEASIQGIESALLSAPNQQGESMKELELSDILSVLQGFTDAESHKVDIHMIKKYLWVGEELYKRSCEIEKNIIHYEDNITRHKFHVKPLDDSQLENWHRYLDFVETQGDFDWIVKLYERCLIPCAHYPEFWIRYMNFVNEQGGKEIANYAFDRSPPFFQKKVPSYRMYCAMMKEELGDSLSARSLLLHDFSPFYSNYVKDVYREANFEKRKGNIKGALKLYENEIKSAVDKMNFEVASSLYVNFAQFTFAATGCRDAARKVFVKGIKQLPCKSLIKGLIQFEMINGGASQIPTIDAIISNVIKTPTDGSALLSYEEREEISVLFLDFVDLYGKTPHIRKAWARHCVLFPTESRKVLPLADSTCNKRAKMEKNTKGICSSPNVISHSNEAISEEKEVNVQPTHGAIGESEREEGAIEGVDMINKCPVLKANSSVPAPDNNSDTNNDIDCSNDVEITDLVRASSEPENIDQKPERSLQLSPPIVSPENSGTSESVKLLIHSELNPHQSLNILGPSPIRPASPSQCKQLKSEMESSSDLHNPNPQPQETSQYKIASSQACQTLPTGSLAQSLNGGAQSGQVYSSQMWQYNQHQLQQMYYYLQLQQQQLQQQVLQQNQSQSGLSSPDNSLQEKQQQLQQQMMYYQQMYQMYMQQSMQVQQQQHWFQIQQQHKGPANASFSQTNSSQFANSRLSGQEKEIPQDKEQSGSSHPSSPTK